MEKELLLVNPFSSNPNPMIPLGLGFLAAVAREDGFSTQVVDAWAEGLSTDDRLRRRLAGLHSPHVAGVSILTPNLQGARQAVSVVRALFPKTLIVIGGPHVSALAQETLNEFPEADLAVFGEGEVTLREILAAYLRTGQTPKDLPGTIWQESGTVAAGPPRGPIRDLDSLPRPARDLFPIDAYRPHLPYGQRRRYMNEITSRGCPFHCAYCSKSVFGDSYRAFSPERVVDDIRELVARYHVREIHFYDDDLTINRKRTVEIMERLIAAKLDLIWSCTTRCDLVDAELLGLMKKAGCWMISYGIESGNEALRDTVEKGVSREQIEAAVRETKRAGIKVTGYFMIGLPGETEETVKETMIFADRLKLHYVNWAVLTVYPGSPFYLDIKNGKYENCRLIKRDSEKGSPFQDSFEMGVEGCLTRERMEALVRQATRCFYLHPCNLLRTLMDIKSFGQFWRTVQTGWNMCQWLRKAKK
jgi:radical SAM superfamily enzyme YgiQ (UPF0313 family)